MSLIELMVATVILAVIASTAIPSLRSLFGRHNLKSVSEIFEQSIQLARAEAIQRSATVRVSPETANDWSSGWKLEFTNPATGADEIIRVFSELPDNPSFTSEEFSVANPLAILPNGQANQLGRFSLFYVDCNGSNKRFDYQILLSGVMKKTISECQ